MAIAAVGTLGVGAASTSGTSFTLTTTTSALSANTDQAILCVASDNVATVDGASNTHTSVTGGNGVWRKLGEYTNTVGGAAADGACVSLWHFRSTGTNAIGTVFTINHGTLVDRCAWAWKFTVAANATFRRAHTPTGYGTDGAVGFGSNTISGLASLSRLYVMGGAKEANATTVLTPSTNFIVAGINRSRNNTLAIMVRGEYRINTSTGETSNPTCAVSGDNAMYFVALFEDTYLGSLVAGSSALAETDTALTKLEYGRKLNVTGNTTYSETPTAVTLKPNYPMTAGVLALSESPVAVTLKRGLRADASTVQTWTETPTAVTLKRGLKLDVTGVKTYAETPVAVGFARTWKADVTGNTAWSESPVAVALKHASKLAADALGLVESAVTVTLKYGRRVDAATRSWAETPTAADLRTTRKIGAGVLGLVESTVDTGLKATRKLAAAGLAWAESTVDAGLRATRKLGAAAQAWSESPVDVGLRDARKTGASATALTLTAQDATLTYTPISGPMAYSLPVDSSSYAEGPVAAGLRRAGRVVGGAEVWSLSSDAVSLLVGHKVGAEAVAFDEHTVDVEMHRGRIMVAAGQSYTLAGIAVGYSHLWRLVADPGQYIMRIAAFAESGMVPSDFKISRRLKNPLARAILYNTAPGRRFNRK